MIGPSAPGVGEFIKVLAAIATEMPGGRMVRRDMGFLPESVSQQDCLRPIYSAYSNYLSTLFYRYVKSGKKHEKP
jgi:hypothetical protein